MSSTNCLFFFGIEIHYKLKKKNCIVTRVEWNNEDLKNIIPELNLVLGEKHLTELEVKEKIIHYMCQKVIDLKSCVIKLCDELKMNPINRRILINDYMNLIISQKKHNTNIIITNQATHINVLLRGFNQEVTTKIKSKNMVLEIIFNEYPVHPPTIELIHPSVNPDLYFKINNLKMIQNNYWAPTRTLSYIVDNDRKIINEYKDLKVDYSIECKKIYTIISSLVNYEIDDLDNRNYRINNERLRNKMYGSDGTGYTTDKSKIWNYHSYIKNQRDTNKLRTTKFNQLILEMERINSADDIIHNTPLVNICIEDLAGIPVLEMYKNEEFYYSVLSVVLTLCKIDTNVLLIKYKTFTLKSIIIEIYKEFEDDDSTIYNIVNKLYKIARLLEDKKEDNKKNKKEEKKNNIENEYVKKMKKYQLSEIEDIKGNSDGYNRKIIMKELATINKANTVHYDASIFVKFAPNNISHWSALIIGPKGTPYENGYFIFDIVLPKTYPTHPPKVTCLSTYGYRINHNIKEDGGICSSLLGTFSGSKGESWNSEISSVMQVLLSIQSLILVDEPYFNEEKYHYLKYTKPGKKQSMEYNLKIKYYTISLSLSRYKLVPDMWKTIVNNHLFFKKQDIINTCSQWFDEFKISSDVNIQQYSQQKESFIELMRDIQYIDDD